LTCSGKRSLFKISHNVSTGHFPIILKWFYDQRVASVWTRIDWTWATHNAWTVESF